jgi:hypothetical protein
VKTDADPIGISAIEVPPADPDLIDRIAAALPEETRAEYYRELRHCRLLPETDEMLRLLRAMQFLVLLIDQAPARVTEERERLEKLLSAAVSSMSRMNAGTEAYHDSLQRKLTALPRDIANGINPEAVAAKINENLRQEFVKSTIPKTAEDLRAISERMKTACVEFSSASDTLGNVYRGAAEDARKAVASMKTEISQAAAASERLTRDLNEKLSTAWRVSMFMLAGGTLVLGLAIGIMLDRWLLR